MEQLTQLFFNNVGAITVTGAFLWYLTKRDKEFNGNLSNVYKLISDHAMMDVKIQKEIAISLGKLNAKIDAKVK